MTKEQEKICDEILRYGEIIKDTEYIYNGQFYRKYEIKLATSIYCLTKCNGVWVEYRERMEDGTEIL